MMYKGRVGSYFLGFTYLLKLASLHCFEDEHCISHGPWNNSIKMDLSKDQANISDDKKHIRKRNLPELSLLSSNHSVQYLCSALQDRTYEAMNLTQIEKSVLHCINSSSPKSLKKTSRESVTISIPYLYKSSNYSTSWYKDCKEFVKNRSEISFKSLKQADSAVYMYTITHMYNAKNYSACGKKRLIVKGNRENTRPIILGGEIVTTIVELASLHCFEDEHCISHGPWNNSIKMDLSKDQANISDDKKHIRKRNLPELSLLSSNHSVQYLCSALQDRTYEAMNLTQIEKSVLHCINSSSPKSLKKTSRESVTISIPYLYKSSNYSTSWYKDCKEFVKNRSEISFKSLKQADSAVYMYTITHMYNAKNYSACGKIRLIVKGNRENTRPIILGGEIVTTIVELGKNYTLTCEAFGDDTAFSRLDWRRTNKSNTEDLDDILDPCNPAMNKTCTGNM
ncbi:uncharacterized protein [Eleutherodactylus coqui]|uniref:uncharacterized protein n=1 Tax=Eleutherodactylus coqui TaxID=57060 RepID=UPI0034617B7C